MSYVQRVLQPGEQVRRISSVHWIVYWPGVAVALLAVVAFWLSGTLLLTGFWRYTAYALALVAIVLLVQQWFQWWVTEIAVTNRRVIYKKGLIRRQTNEMNMDKVESVKIDQSILGRMLDFGNVKILGTGEGFETLRTIPSPIELRNSIITGDAQSLDPILARWHSRPETIRCCLNEIRNVWTRYLRAVYSPFDRPQPHAFRIRADTPDQLW